MRITREGLCSSLNTGPASHRKPGSYLREQSSVAVHFASDKVKVLRITALSSEAGMGLDVEEYGYSPKYVLKGDEMIQYREPATIVSKMRVKVELLEEICEEMIVRYDGRGHVAFVGVATDVMIYS